MEYRTDRFYRMDPHVYPSKDGVDVFFINLEGPSVVTFSPPDENLRYKQSIIATSSFSDNGNKINGSKLYSISPNLCAIIFIF